VRRSNYFIEKGKKNIFDVSVDHLVAALFAPSAVRKSVHSAKVCWRNETFCSFCFPGVLDEWEKPASRDELGVHHQHHHQ
jgi:hypothetical protein